MNDAVSSFCALVLTQHGHDFRCRTFNAQIRFKFAYDCGKNNTVNKCMYRWNYRVQTSIFLVGKCTVALDICGVCGGEDQSGITCPEVVAQMWSSFHIYSSAFQFFMLLPTHGHWFTFQIWRHHWLWLHDRNQKFYSAQASKKLSPPSSCKSTKTSSPYRSKGWTWHHNWN